MCSTEEASALLHRSREAELVESGAEVESVVESLSVERKKLVDVGVMMKMKRRVEAAFRRKLVCLLSMQKNMCQALVTEQIPVMTVVESMRVLLQLGLSILPQVMIGMTLITWHGRKVIFSRN